MDLDHRLVALGGCYEVEGIFASHQSTFFGPNFSSPVIASTFLVLGNTGPAAKLNLSLRARRSWVEPDNEWRAISGSSVILIFVLN